MMDSSYYLTKARRHAEKGDIKGALSEVDTLIEKLEKSHSLDYETLGRECNSIAEFVYFELGSHRHAISIYAKVADAYSKAGKDSDAAYIHYRIGEIYDIDLEDTIKAAEAFNTALGIYIKSGDMGIPTALCLEKVAHMYKRLDDIEMALKSITISLDIRRDIAPNTSDTALAIHNAGKMCFEMRAIDEAIALLKEAEVMYKALDDQSNLSSIKEEIKIVLEYKKFELK